MGTQPAAQVHAHFGANPIERAARRRVRHYTHMIKPIPKFLSASIALALTFTLSPLSFAQDGKVEVSKPDVKAPAPMPAVKWIILRSRPILPSYAPIVEKVAPAVVTISTSKMVKGGVGAVNPNGNNPLFNDPTFRRFFGIPDQGGNGGDEDQAPAPAPGRKHNNENNGNGNNGKAGRDDKGHKQPLGLGSGVIVSSDGYILTNNHVVEGADDISVTIGDSPHEYKAKKSAPIPGSDVAVIKIDGKDLPAITFADSDQLRPGDIVIAVGNPFGLTRSATMGVVSAIGRGGMGIVDYENFIQTDASINMGNSGGALVDYDGRLVGINTAIFSRTGGNQGIGFAVPANLARNVMESILKTGHVQRGFLGVGLQPLNEDLVKAFKLKSDDGALISEVQPKSPAEKAGVQTGDVVTAVNGKDMKSPRELQLLVGSMSPKAKVDVKLLREGQEKTVTVDLGERPGKGLAAQNDAPEKHRARRARRRHGRRYRCGCPQGSKHPGEHQRRGHHPDRPRFTVRRRRPAEGRRRPRDQPRENHRLQASGRDEREAQEGDEGAPARVSRKAPPATWWSSGSNRVNSTQAHRRLGIFPSRLLRSDMAQE